MFSLFLSILSRPIGSDSTSISAPVLGFNSQHGLEVLSSCCSQVGGSHVRLCSRGTRTCSFDFAENVQDHDAANIDETNQHDCLRAELEALRILEERS